MHISQVIKKPLVTEKSTNLQVKQNYMFKVDTRANKKHIKAAVEKMFKVSVINVNVLIVPGKEKTVGRHRVQRPSWKKAIVTLAPGNKIEFFEGV
jgi:large subunit ribosomal protein L23